MRLLSLVFPGANSAVIAAAIITCFASTARAQSYDGVYPPFFQYNGAGTVYTDTFSDVAATGSETGCLYDSFESPTFGIPSGAGPVTWLPTTGCDGDYRLELSQSLTESITQGGVPLTMSGYTQEVGNAWGVTVSSNLQSVGPNNGGLVTASASYYQQNIETPPRTFGDTLSVSFNTTVNGVGAATFAAACLWSEEAYYFDCHTVYTGDPSEFELSIYPVGSRYTINMLATTLNETVGSTTAASIVLQYPYQDKIARDRQEDRVYNWHDWDPSDAIDPAVRDAIMNGDDVGLYTTANGDTEGFEGLPGGSFMPIIPPLDNAGFTVATGINNSGTIVGAFEENIGGGVDRYRGYLLNDGSFTTYDEGPDVSTSIFGINDKGDFAGTFFGFGGNSQPVQGYLQLASGGAPVTFSAPGASATYAEGVNDSDSVVGLWADFNGVTHGFYLPFGGRTPISFDFPGAAGTFPFSINDAGAISGYFTDTSGINHGFVGPLGRLVQYDLAGAASTAPLALNNEGVVAGSYVDKEGVQHGFTAQLCTPNVSNSVTVSTEGFVHLPTGEFFQVITVTNTSTHSITGPIYILLEDLPLGVIVDNGNLTSVCASPGTPYVSVKPPENKLLPGQQVTTTVNFANFSAGAISDTTSVLAGPLVP